MDTIDETIIANADEGLLHLIEKAKVAVLSKEEYAEYEASLKALSDEGLAENFGYRRGRQEGKAEGRQEGKAEGRQEGKAEGRHEEKIETVKMLLANGVDINIIAKCCRLSVEEVLKLKEE